MKGVYVTIIQGEEKFDESIGDYVPVPEGEEHEAEGKLIVIKTPNDIPEDCYLSGDEDAFAEDIYALEDRFGTIDWEGTLVDGVWAQGFFALEVEKSDIEDLARALKAIYDNRHDGGSLGYELVTIKNDTEDMHRALRETLK